LLSEDGRVRRYSVRFEKQGIFISNYSQTTIFTPKDSLPTNDPNKTIFGALFDTEFGNIASAVNSKPDNLTAASFLNINVTGSGVPANGWYLPSANTLGVATNSVQRGTIDSSGKWTINAPSSGVPLTVTSLASTNGATFLVPSGSAAIFVGIQGQTNNPRIVITPTEASGNSDINFAASTATVAGSISVNSTASISFSASRNVTIGAPISGSTLYAIGASGITSFTGNTPMALRVGGSTSTTDYSGIDFWGTGSSQPAARIAHVAAGSGSSLLFGTSNNYGTGITNTAMTINQNGNVLINAAVSNVNLQVVGVTANTIATFSAASGDSSSGGVKVIDGGANASTLQFYTNNGNVFINTAGTATPGLIVQLGGSTKLAIATGGDITARGVQLVKYMSANETRTTSGGAVTNSTQLAVSIAAAGTYAIRVVVFSNTGGGAGVGQALGLNYSGTFTAASSPCYGQSPGVQTGSQITAAVNSTLLTSTSGSPTAAAPNCSFFDATLTATGAGTLTVSFGQGASSATTVTYMIGSFIKVTPVS
jgi:hypothetical protein